ncbi:MAG: DUF488 domain-containing protein [Bacteroidetes bacterium]|nr:MAG: DUF488 domain-containing protein [Bacteroidota bacterium]
MEFFTLGVYNLSDEEFFYRLMENGIDTFCDIRQRRGVRGAKYCFVNSNRLQQRLANLNIRYLYVQNLAPTKEIREFQKKFDRKKGESKTDRRGLGDLFIERYKESILSSFDFAAFFDTLQSLSANRIAYFCVEQFPRACHRSLVADELFKRFGFRVTNL